MEKKLLYSVTLIMIFAVLFGCNNEQVSNETVATAASTETNTTVSEQSDVQDDPEKILEVKAETGFQAPNFFFVDETGEEVSLNQLRGKPVLMVFWASWWPHCKAELPSVEKLYQKYKESIIIIAVNVREKKDKAVLLIDESNYTFPVIYDEERLITDLYRVQPIPLNIFINKSGVISKKVVGAVKESELEKYIISLIE